MNEIKEHKTNLPNTCGAGTDRNNNKVSVGVSPTDRKNANL